MRNEVLDTVQAELTRFGISPVINQDGKHIKLRWKNPTGHVRQMTLGKTASDHRARLNMLCQVRRIMKDDGVHPLPPKTKNATLLERAFSVAPTPAPLADRVLKLEEQVAVLTDLLLELISGKEAAVVETKSPTNGHAVPLPMPVRQRGRHGKLTGQILGALEFSLGKSPGQVAELIGRPKNVVSVYLSKLKQTGRVRNVGRGSWIKTKAA